MGLSGYDLAIFNKRHGIHNSVKDALNLLGSAQLIFK
jgi:hypothetical protein